MLTPNSHMQSVSNTFLGTWLSKALNSCCKISFLPLKWAKLSFKPAPTTQRERICFWDWKCQGFRGTDGILEVKLCRAFFLNWTILFFWNKKLQSFSSTLQSRSLIDSAVPFQLLSTKKEEEEEVSSCSRYCSRWFEYQTEQADLTGCDGGYSGALLWKGKHYGEHRVTSAWQTGQKVMHVQ